MNKDTKATGKATQPPAKGKMIEMPEDMFTPEGVLMTSPLPIGKRIDSYGCASRKIKNRNQCQ